MQEIIQKLKDILRRELVVLWLFSVIFGSALIVLANKNKLPLHAGDFVFVTILTLLVALYRPRWIFFLFVSLIPLENIILVSGFLPVQLRPYQFLGAILIVAVAILFSVKRLNFRLFKPAWQDYLVIFLVPLSFLSSLNASNKSVALKNSLILLSFVFLYYLARNFVRNRKDLAKTAFFFVGSNLVVAGYGFYQIFADKFGARSFEIMFGRPNSTFTEADWLGMYLCLALSVLLALVFYSLRNRRKLFVSRKYFLWALDVLIFIDAALLILTLSRSAWIGLAVVLIFYLIANIVHKSDGKSATTYNFSRFARESLIILFIILISLAVIQFGKLSKFDIFDRARSTATSEQKITVACEPNSQIPASVGRVEELPNYNCKFINLEEIGYYKSQGKDVREIFRKDPNVMTRGAVYQKTWEEIKKHPILGIGFGTITQALGTDSRGAGLNESNIFLQIWAGSGILGLIAFLFLIGGLFISAFRRVSPICLLNKIAGYPAEGDDFEKTSCVFAVLGIAALIVPGLFNAGLLMGIFWLALATFVISARNLETGR